MGMTDPSVMDTNEMTADEEEIREALTKVSRETLVDMYVTAIDILKSDAMAMEANGNVYNQVARQHFHFKVDAPTTPEHLTPREKKFRFRCMREELEEYEDAETLEEELDALVDLVVFALGSAYRHGFHYFNEALRRVVEVNKNKVVGPTANRGKRFGDLDLQKPPDWEPADLSDLAKGVNEER